MSASPPVVPHPHPSLPALRPLAALLLPLALTACSGSATAEGVSVRVSKADRQAEARQEAAVPAAGGATASGDAPAVPAQPAAAASPAAPAAPGSVSTGGPGRMAKMPDRPFTTTVKATFNEPWAMSFLPDGRLLVTEKSGTLRLYNPANDQVGSISGVPAVDYGGQGGLGDVMPHPGFAQNRWVYFSYVEAGANDTRGAVVARAALTQNASGGGSLGTPEVIWRQTPKVSGRGHYSHRIAFGPDGKLWITSGDRQKLDPAQSMDGNLGKLIRLNADGSVPADNPFAAQGGVAAQVWSLGHRNLLGIAFDHTGKLWTHEMGPAHGDELNLAVRGANHGWPNVSNGDHYDGAPIPDHREGDGYVAPKAWWNPTIAPAGFMIYTGEPFWYFRNNGFIGGLASQALIRIQFNGTEAREVSRYPMGRRIREVEQGPDGAIWVLEDGSGGRLLRLDPVRF